jgi:sugar lactone lactonase YvrE
MVVRRRILVYQLTVSAVLACAAVFGGGERSVAAEYIVTDQASGRVLAFDADTGVFTRTLVSGLQQPSAISRGPDSSLYVTDLLAGTVIKINPVTGANSVFASGIDKPGSIHFDEWNGTLYVGEFGDFGTFQFGDEIFSYAADGTRITANTINAGPTGHSGLTTDAEGNLYVSGFFTDGFGSGHVLKYSTPWEPNPLSPLGVFAPAPAPSPLLQGAAGLAFDTAGNLFVAGLTSNNTGRLVKFLVTNGVVTGEVDFDSTISFPSGMTLLPDGSLVVTSLGAGQLYKYNTVTAAREEIIQGAFNGNFNGDQVVDGADLTAWQMAFGAGASADADGDGDSDGNDFLSWQRSAGGPALFSPSGVVYYEAPLAAAIPEPATGLLGVCAAVVGLAARRSRRFGSGASSQDGSAI